MAKWVTRCGIPLTSTAAPPLRTMCLPTSPPLLEAAASGTTGWTLGLGSCNSCCRQTVRAWSGQSLQIPKAESKSEVAQSCQTLCDPVDCSPPFFSVHEIFQARILEWVAISFSRGSNWPKDQTQVSCIAGRLFTIWATRESLRAPKSELLPMKYTSSLHENIPQ